MHWKEFLLYWFCHGSVLIGFGRLYEASVNCSRQCRQLNQQHQINFPIEKLTPEKLWMLWIDPWATECAIPLNVNATIVQCPHRSWLFKSIQKQLEPRSTLWPGIHFLSTAQWTVFLTSQSMVPVWFLWCLQLFWNYLMFLRFIDYSAMRWETLDSEATSKLVLLKSLLFEHRLTL